MLFYTDYSRKGNHPLEYHGESLPEMTSTGTGGGVGLSAQESQRKDLVGDDLVPAGGECELQSDAAD